MRRRVALLKSIVQSSSDCIVCVDSAGTLRTANPAAEMLFGSASGELVGVYPEGFKGVGKPFSERYKLQRFGRGGFVSAALRTKAPIIPCSIVGAEEIYPMLGNAKKVADLLRLPYFPITPLFPWLGPVGMVPLPSRWIIEFCPPVHTNGYRPGDEADPAAGVTEGDEILTHDLHADRRAVRLGQLARQRDRLPEAPEVLPHRGRGAGAGQQRVVGGGQHGGPILARGP